MAGLSDERREAVEEMGDTLRDIHTSATTVFGVAPTRIIDAVGMLALQSFVRAQHAEQAVSDLRARVDMLGG